jgi:nucleoside-diphosphate-sugar epimerase
VAAEIWIPRFARNDKVGADQALGIRMRVLVIGGTGFIGKHIVARFAIHEHEVIAFHRGQTPAVVPENVREILDPHSVLPIQRFPKELLRLEPDVVIHTMMMGLPDAQACVSAFGGKTGRLVVLSSGDVYRAYGCFIGTEPGTVEQGLLTEDSPLRRVLYPYREKAASPATLEYWYDKILAEQVVLHNSGLPVVVLRLPKVYGKGSNEDLATIYRYPQHPHWRWTHGYVENVAAAVELAGTHPNVLSRVYNVGEENTPTIAERLAWMPYSSMEPDLTSNFNFAQDIAYDTSRIRRELGYHEVVEEREALLKTLRSQER